MDFLSAVDLKSLGSAGITIALLIWHITKQTEVIKSIDLERKEWQEKAFDISRETQKEMFETTQIFERIVEELRNSRSP